MTLGHAKTKGTNRAALLELRNPERSSQKCASRKYHWIFAHRVSIIPAAGSVSSGGSFMNVSDLLDPNVSARAVNARVYRR